MENKQIIDGVDVSECEYCLKMTKYRCTIQRNVYKCLCEENPNCYYKQLKRKEQELEEICKAFDIEYAIHKETGDLFGRCNKLYKKEQECEELRRSIIKIFACLIKANNRGKIIDTLWVDDITTLWDYIALTLGIEGDQTQIEEQILQK